jgi:hypothetical protein
MEYDLHLAKLALLADLWTGFDLLSYSAGLFTAAPMLLLAALIARLTDRPRAEPEPEPASGRVELLSINDLDPCPRCGGDHDRIDKREPCEPSPRAAYDPYLEADDESNPAPEPEWDRYPGPIGS